jgi:hypothetical protein
MDIKRRIEEIKDVTVKPPYLYSFIAITAAYLTLNIYLNQFTEVLPVFLSFNLKFVIPYVLLTFLIGILVATNLNLIFMKLKNFTKLKKEGGLTAFGIFGGLLGGACPGCFVGLFPTIAAVFGSTMTLAALPFKGFEIQIPTAAILLITLLLLTRKNVCKTQK